MFSIQQPGSGYTKELVLESAQDAIETLEKISDDLQVKWKFVDTAPQEIITDDSKARAEFERIDSAIKEIKEIRSTVDSMDEAAYGKAVHRISDIRTSIVYG